MLRSRGRMYAKKIAQFTKPGKMLDVGAAAGYILQGFVESGWIGMGLEPNASMAALGSSQLGLDVCQGSLESIETDECFDLISMIQVDAHFYDAKLAFQKAYELLNPGGLLLIETWDRSSVSAANSGGVTRHVKTADSSKAVTKRAPGTRPVRLKSWRDVRLQSGVMRATKP